MFLLRVISSRDGPAIVWKQGRIEIHVCNKIALLLNKFLPLFCSRVVILRVSSLPGLLYPFYSSILA